MHLDGPGRSSTPDGLRDRLEEIRATRAGRRKKWITTGLVSLVILTVVGFFAYQWLTFNWVQATAGLGSVRLWPVTSSPPGYRRTTE
jgi:hypothetical protein